MFNDVLMHSILQFVVVSNGKVISLNAFVLMNLLIVSHRIDYFVSTHINSIISYIKTYFLIDVQYFASHPDCLYVPNEENHLTISSQAIQDETFRQRFAIFNTVFILIMSPRPFRCTRIELFIWGCSNFAQ